MSFCSLALPFNFCMASTCWMKTRSRRVARSTFESIADDDRFERLPNRQRKSRRPWQVLRRRVSRFRFYSQKHILMSLIRRGFFRVVNHHDFNLPFAPFELQPQLLLDRCDH